MTRVLVCGGRDFTDQKLLDEKLDWFHSVMRFSALIQGECIGADLRAKSWAKSKGIPVLPFKADWYPNGRSGGLDKSAGPKRNLRMLKEGKPDVVIAFNTGGPGTRNMIDLAKAAGVSFHEVSRAA